MCSGAQLGVAQEAESTTVAIMNVANKAEGVRDSPVSNNNKPETDEETVDVAPGAGSVETNCPICLDEMVDKSFLDTCFHILLSQVARIRTLGTQLK